jgi:hypothetical protein
MSVFCPGLTSDALGSLRYVPGSLSLEYGGELDCSSLNGEVARSIRIFWVVMSPFVSTAVDSLGDAHCRRTVPASTVGSSRFSGTDPLA